MRPLFKAALLLLAIYALHLVAWTTSGLHGVRVPLLLPRDPCAQWDPSRPDPPNCLRARQYREVQAYHASGA
jgi:hypothetical protein